MNNIGNSRPAHSLVMAAILSLWVLGSGPSVAALADETIDAGTEWTPINTGSAERVTLSFRDVEISEVMDMLSRKDRVNIVLGKGVSGTVSINLYDVTTDEAVRAIASAGGYAVERRNGSYFVVSREEVGKYTTSQDIQVRSFKVQYSDPKIVEEILKNYLSSYGKITALTERQLLIVEDQPRFMRRIEELLREIDREPKQILIQAQILEVTLNDTESYGFDWAKLFDGKNSVVIGTQGLSNFVSPGFFFNLVGPKVAAALNALKSRGRVRALSTPKLLALENQEASVVIGDRLGYNVTTTIDQVTTTSVEFLESGVILRVTPSVDARGRIRLDIHPEVSTGSLSNGLPNQRTTEVTTQLLVPDGRTVFIGGLMRRNTSETRDGVPILGDIPGVGRLFSNNEKVAVSTETVVLITPIIVGEDYAQRDIAIADPVPAIEKVFKIDRVLSNAAARTDRHVEPPAFRAPQTASKKRKRRTFEPR